MFNVAVVNKKDILKYLVSITVTLCAVMFVTRYFSNLEQDEKFKLEIDRKISELMQTSLLLCLDETIPGIKEINHELKTSDEEEIDENYILGNLLKIELSMFREETKIAEVQNVEISQSQELETSIEPTDIQENYNIEIQRRYNNTSSNTKSLSR